MLTSVNRYCLPPLLTLVNKCYNRVNITGCTVALPPLSRLTMSYSPAIITPAIAPLNQKPASQHCEFLNDQSLIYDWLSEKSQNTAKAYFTTLKQVYGFCGGLPLAQWSKLILKGFLNSLVEKGQKISTINRKLAAVKSLLAHAVREGYLSLSVATHIKRLKPRHTNVEANTQEVTERVIGHEGEVWRLINSTNNRRDYLLLKITYLLGLRAFEVAKLHWDDVTPSKHGYKLKIIGKGSKTSFLPLDKKLYSELLELGDSGYIFSSKTGGKLSRTRIHRIIKACAKQAGLSDKISTHWLRHQRCSDLVNSGCFTLSQVQKFMRHSSLKITEQYIHVDNEIGSDALLP